MLFCQIAFVLRGEIHTPVNRVFEFPTAVFQNCDRIGVINLGEVCINKMFQTRNRIFIDTLGEEFHIIRAFIQYGFEDVFQHRFGKASYVIQVGKGDFRLQHPELSQVAAGVGVFCTECRAKGIDFGQGARIGFAVQLAGYGQERFFTKEVFIKIDFALVVTRQVFQIQC